MKRRGVVFFLVLLFFAGQMSWLYADEVGDDRIERLEALVKNQQMQIEALQRETEQLKAERGMEQQEMKEVRQALETWPGTTQLPKPVPEDLKVLVGGNIDLTYTDEEDLSSTFDNHHFNPIILAKVTENVLMESELEYETGGTDIALEYAQIDWLLNDYVTFVAGKFLVPFGVFNERLHPNWINKVPNRPLPMNEVIPVDWTDVGIQARGNLPLGEWFGSVPEQVSMECALYLVNGLEGTEGVSLRSLRTGARTDDNNNKALGGRMGLKLPPWAEFGASLYRGAYTPRNASDDLTIFGFDGAYFWSDRFELRGELIFTEQDVLNRSSLKKAGWSFQGAYKLS